MKTCTDQEEDREERNREPTPLMHASPAEEKQDVCPVSTPRALETTLISPPRLETSATCKRARSDLTTADDGGEFETAARGCMWRIACDKLMVSLIFLLERTGRMDRMP
jgi:hypothetical protein